MAGRFVGEVHLSPTHVAAGSSHESDTIRTIAVLHAATAELLSEER